MRRCFLLVLGALVMTGCGDDEPAEGTRGPCASGGAINECDPFEMTPEAACDRLVECGVYRENPGDFDWAACINEMGRRSANGTLQFTIACIAASGCDEAGACLLLGDN